MLRADIEARTMRRLLSSRGFAHDSQSVLTAVKRRELRPRHRVNISRSAGDGYSGGPLDGINANNLKPAGHPFQQNWVARLRDIEFWHMPQVSHRSAFDSSPVEIKRHHYPSRAPAFTAHVVNRVSGYRMILSMSKRSSRRANRNAPQAPEDAIGSSLGKTPTAATPGNTGSEARDARIERPLRRPKRTGREGTRHPWRGRNGENPRQALYLQIDFRARALRPTGESGNHGGSRRDAPRIQPGSYPRPRAL
jgi:hypothetical protein